MRKPIGWIAAIVTVLSAAFAGNASAQERFGSETRVAPSVLVQPFGERRAEARDRAREVARLGDYGRYERLRLERVRAARLRRIEELRIAREHARRPC